MADAVDFTGSNMVLRAPSGEEDRVSSLHTFTNGSCSVSCWQLSEEEIEEVRRTGRVFVSIWSGRTQPPVFVGSEDAVRNLVVDYGGVWRKA